MIEGKKCVEELLKSSLQIRHVVCTEEFAKDFPMATVVSERDLASMTSLKKNSRCLAVAAIAENKALAVPCQDTFVLDSISDPGNLGSILRSLDFYGYHHLCCTSPGVDPYNPKTVQSSMGSLFRVNVTHVSRMDLIGRGYPWRKVVAMSLDGLALQSYQPESPSLYILGNESHGIREDMLEMADLRLNIAGQGNADSLNVSVACATLLYHLSMHKPRVSSTPQPRSPSP